jgi:hypothetical protein
MGRISQLNLQFTAMPQTPKRVSWLNPCRLSRLQSFAEAESVRQSVDELAYTEPNWDGYGALPISGEAKRNAITALNAFVSSTPPPTVVPNPNGTLSFEWESEHGIGHLEIGKNRYSFYVKPNSGRAILSDGDADKIGSFLGSFVEGVLYPKPSEPAFLNLEFLAANV